MSQLGVILALVFSIFIAIFALANNQPIAINYLVGKTDVSAVLVILGAAFLGALTIFLLGVYRQVKAVLRLRALQGELTELRTQLQAVEQERDSLLLQLGQWQEETTGAEGWACAESAGSGGAEGKTKKTAVPDGPGTDEEQDHGRRNCAPKEEQGL